MGTAAKTYSRACQSGFRYRNGKCVPSFEALWGARHRVLGIMAGRRAANLCLGKIVVGWVKQAVNMPRTVRIGTVRANELIPLAARTAISRPVSNGAFHR